MRVPGRKRSVSRVIVALLVAVITIARGGGVALACESTVPGPSAAGPSAAPSAHASHTSAGEDAAPGREGCDAPDRVRECLLMPACAPAISPSVTMAADVVTTAPAVTLPSPNAPAPVDRSPEPPPPRR